MNCVQGIVQLSQAGPNDGGLMVLKGSAKYFDQFFEENPVTGPTPWRSVKHKDFHPFMEKDVEWYQARGCEAIKVCAEPGDLIIWDSRTVHVSIATPSSIMKGY
jgi:ectoine hydroxylase-related dioxygenase (phytanoyl-CoA dioxygenase family)